MDDSFERWEGCVSKDGGVFSKRQSSTTTAYLDSRRLSSTLITAYAN